MTQTLGQTAYEAFTHQLGAHRLRGDEREGPWAKLPPIVQKAWEATAREVVRVSKGAA